MRTFAAVCGACLLLTATFAAREAAATASPSARHDISYKLAWTKQLDYNADSTAVVDPNVRLKNGTHANLVIVLAGNNDDDCIPSNPVRMATTYAFKESNGALVWKRSTRGQGRCTTAAPAIWHGWVLSPGLDGRIHRYAAATGSEYHKHGWPKLFTKQPYVEKSSAALVVSGSYLYLATSGFTGDAGHYEGHLVTVNMKTNHENVWNSLCSHIHKLITDVVGRPSYCPVMQAGMFGRGQAAIDPLNHDVYVVTGNGPWNGNTNWGDSVLKLNPQGAKLLDAFTPTNQAYLNNSDSDLGSTGPAVLPPVKSDGRTYHLLVQGGKGGYTSSGGSAVLWLVNRDQMGPQPGPGHLGGQLQHIDSPGGCEVLTAPAVWVNSQKQPIVIYANACGVTAYAVKTGPSSPPRLAVDWSFSAGSTTPVMSGNRLFIAHNGEIDAYNPANGQELWSSSNAGAGGTIGGVHWEYPSVSGTWLFQTDEGAKLYAYKVS